MMMQSVGGSYAPTPARGGGGPAAPGATFGGPGVNTYAPAGSAYPNSSMMSESGGAYSPAPSARGYPAPQETGGSYGNLTLGAPPTIAAGAYGNLTLGTADPSSQYNAAAFDAAGYGAVPRAGGAGGYGTAM